MSTLCTRCWADPPCRHTTDERLEPERYRMYHLCVLCCRSWAPLRSRWSWLACPDCMHVNAAIKAAYGAPVRLPLGRHSIMNGAGIRLAEEDPDIRAAQEERFEFLSVEWGRLFDWQKEHARHLQSRLLPSPYQESDFLPTAVWEEHVVGRMEHSRQAWLDCSGLASYAELHEHAVALADLGLLDPPTVGADWRP